MDDSAQAKAGEGPGAGAEGAEGVAPTDQPDPGELPAGSWGRTGAGAVAGSTQGLTARPEASARSKGARSTPLPSRATAQAESRRLNVEGGMTGEE